jgi:trimeric autotransporter adhesin
MSKPAFSLIRFAIGGHKPRAHFVHTALLVGGVALVLSGVRAWSQQYAIDGGFEAATLDPAPKSAGDASLWTKDSQDAGAWLVSGGTPRTGGKCMEFQVYGIAYHKLQTKQTRFNSVSKVVVQYYYKNGSQQTANVATAGGIKYSGVSVDGTQTGAAAPWTKKVDILTVSGTPASTDFAYIKVWSFGSAGEADYYIDDVAVYDGTTVDEMAPDAPTSPSVSVESLTSLSVSWTAPTGGVDGGGYLVVRGLSDPTAAPNTNGVYAVGNTVATGQTVVYIGAAMSFTNSALTSGSTYYYRIYAFDKAFNYSGAAGGAAVSGRPCAATPTAGSDSPVCAGATLHLTASTVTGATYAWTGPNGFTSSDQNPTLANVTTSASGSYSVTATVSGCTSTPGTTSVTVNALPTGGADALSTPKNTAATVSSAKLKVNDTGTGLQVVAVTADTGPNHGAVVLSGTDGTVTYTPKADYSGGDSFTYTLSNDHGCTVQVPVTVTVGSGQSGSANVLYAGTVDGNFVVRFAGIPGESYTVEANSVASGPGWAKLGTENFKAPEATDPHPYGIGVFQVTDPLGSLSRYYRTVWPAY